MGQVILYSTRGAANMLGISELKFKALRNDPDFPKPVVNGTATRWRREDLLGWVNRRKK